MAFMRDRRLAACRRRNRRMRSLVRTAALLNSSLDLDEILRNALQTASRVMEAEASSILLLDPETGDLIVHSLDYRGPAGSLRNVAEVARGYRVPAGQGIAGWVARTGSMLNIPDAYADPRFHKEVDRRTGLRTRSILALPLRSHDTLIGVAEVLNRRDERPFGREDVVLFHHFCDLASVAIEKARLHESRLEKEALERELAAAREIQNAFLPRELPEIEGFAFGRHYVAAQEVGGDFYDLVSCPRGLMGLVVGDVAGKGVSAALMGAGVATELRILLQEECRPGEIARRANALVAERSVHGRFVTLFVGLLDVKTGEIAYSSLGHEPPLHYESSGRRARFLEDGSGPPAGVLPGATFQENRLRLAPGDRLVLYTDGLVEALDPDAETAGMEKLRRILEERGASSATLERQIEEVAAPPEEVQVRRDDLTYLEVRRLEG